MDEQKTREQLHQAIDATLSGLTGDPWLQRRVLAQAEQGGNKVKTRKLSLGLIVVIALLLAAVSAAAAAFLSGREVIEGTAVPLARENDSELRVHGEYTVEQLAELVRVANENGITLDETTGIMQALRKGEGYYEEEAIMEICREAFSGLFYDWTIEQKSWFEHMLVQIGYQADWAYGVYPLPGEEDMTVEQARAYAVQALKAEYGPDIAIDDPALYKRQEDFLADVDEQGNLYPPIWYFNFIPRDLDHAAYGIMFERDGEIDSMDEVPPVPFSSPDELIDRMTYLFGQQSRWTQETWHEMDLRLQTISGESNQREYRAYALSHYPLPEAGDLSATEAKAIANPDPAGGASSAILLGDREKRVWKVSQTVEREEGSALRSWEIDAATGDVLWQGETGGLAANQPWAKRVLHGVYEEVMHGVRGEEEVKALAMAALRKALKDDTVPFDDPDCYQADVSFADGVGRWFVYFRTQRLEYGTCSLVLNNDTGEVALITALSAPGLNGDNAYTRFKQVHREEWTQDTWVAFGNVMKDLEPTTMDGKLLKNTVYPPLREEYLTREQAVDIAYADLNAPWAEELHAVLIGAEPHPVWKIRMWAEEPSILYEIDAVTGEILDKEKYKADNYDFNSPIKLVTLHRDYAPAYNAEYGLPRASAIALSLEFGDATLDDPLLPLLEEDQYEILLEDRAVTFRAQNPEESSYRVTFDEGGLVESTEKLP